MPEACAATPSSTTSCESLSHLANLAGSSAQFTPNSAAAEASVHTPPASEASAQGSDGWCLYFSLEHNRNWWHHQGTGVSMWELHTPPAADCASVPPLPHHVSNGHHWRPPLPPVSEVESSVGPAVNNDDVSTKASQQTVLAAASNGTG